MTTAKKVQGKEIRTASQAEESSSSSSSSKEGSSCNHVYRSQWW
jgi:hypothetical protein